MEPYARQKKKVRTGGEKGKHMLPRLVLKVYEGKTSYELPRKVKVMIKKESYLLEPVFLLSVLRPRTALYCCGDEQQHQQHLEHTYV